MQLRPTYWSYEVIGRTLVDKKQLRRFGGSTTNKLVVQDDWSYVGQRTIVGCKFDAKMANQLYGQLFPCGVVRTQFPIPKILTVLQEMEGFAYASALDLNMGYYTIID